MKLSTSEQQLVDFATGQFGEHMTHFLLAGLGEEVRGRRWQFTITYVGEGGKALQRRVRAITHEPEDGTGIAPAVSRPTGAARPAAAADEGRSDVVV